MVCSKLLDHCLSYLSCLFVLPVMLVYCHQMVGWMKLGMQVSLSPGHIVLHGDPAPLHKKGKPKGHSPPIFGLYLLWPNGWMDQDATWYEGRPWLKPHCYMGIELPPIRGTAHNFRPMSIVAKRSPISATAEHLYKRSPKNSQYYL